MRIPDTNNNYVEFDERRVGLEFENPLTTHSGALVESPVIQAMYHNLVERYGWKENTDSISGNILSVDKNIGGRNTNVSTDCAWSSIELALPPADSLHNAKDVFDEVRGQVLGSLTDPTLRWLGIGMIPGSLDPIDQLKTTKPLYTTVKHLFFHNTYLALNAHQAGVSIRLDECIRVVNELIKISGLVVALCANASIQNFQVSAWKDWRIVAWRFLLLTNQSTGIRTTFPDHPFRSLADYFSHFWQLDDTPFMCPLRNGRSIEFDDRVSWLRYFRGSSWPGKFVGGETTEMIPGAQDLNIAGITMWPFAKLHVVFDPTKVDLLAFMDALDHDTLETYIRGRYTNMYVEFRPVAASPIGEELALPSLVLGLVNTLSELEAFSKRFAWNEWKVFVDHAAIAGMEAKIGGIVCRELMKEFVDIAKRGLAMRKMNEDVYLDPLYARIENAMNPADEMNMLLKEKGKQEFLDTITYRK